MVKQVQISGERYWPLLDGLRAISVLAVVGYHTDLPFARSGFAGVDVFFVISGFLITHILLDESTRTGTVNLRRFYARRALRLLPALVAVCIFVLGVASFTGQHFSNVAKGVVACLLYVSNIWIYSGHETTFLQHTWTLSIEEQFYVVWPILLVLLIAAGRRKRACLIILYVAIPALLIWAPLGAVAAAVQGNYLRGTGLIVGCLLAWGNTVWKIRVHRAITAITLSLLAILLFSPWRSPSALLTSGYSTAVLLTVPVILGLTQSQSAFALLRSRPATWIGQRSYGLYLWHFPILSLAVHQSPQAVPLMVRVGAGIATAFIAAAVSYRFIETPFRRKRARLESYTGPLRVRRPTSSGSFGAEPQIPTMEPQIE